VNVGGSGQGQYGEGMSDVMGVIILDQSQLGVGFQSCTTGIRNANNTIQYPCTGAIHDCGQLISGCVWDTRAELLVTEPVNYSQILRDLAVNAIPMHRGETITPQITIDWLTLDDDDTNIGNGTPHYWEIATGFGAHNMDAPPLDLLSFEFPNGLPEIVNPNGGTSVRVVVLPNVADPQPGTGLLHYRVSGSFVQVAMVEVEPNVYDAVFPPVDCGAFVDFYFSAETTGGQVMREPGEAPAVTHSAMSAVEVVVAFADNFETNQGWTAENLGASSGDWQRGVPVNDPSWEYDPISDSDGSGQCFVTQNEMGNTDVDNGAVQLTSPMIDMSAGNFSISYDYYLYLTNTSGGVDRLLVEISSNGSAGPWTEIARHTTNGSLEWRNHVISAQDLATAGVTMTAQMMVRFTANDGDPQSINESGLDAFKITRVICEPAFENGDLNCDGAFNGGDIDPFFLALGDPAAYAATYPNCDIMLADMNRDGAVNGADIDTFFECLGGGCP
jgi:hypothetical protein